MLDKKYYVYGSRLFYSLSKIGGTTVFRFITDYGVKGLLSERMAVDDMNDSVCETIVRGVLNEDKESIHKALVYLFTIDDSITQYDLQFESKKFYKESLCGEDENVLMYPTNTPHSHFYHANENICTLFVGIYYIIRNKAIKITNYYLDKDYCNSESIEIEFVSYPINENIIEKVDGKSVFFDERKGDKIDKMFLKRIERAITTPSFLTYKIVVAPEIVGNRYLDDKIYEIVKKTNKSSCILCPSYHHIENGKRYNSSLAIIDENGINKRIRLYKYRGMDTKKDELREDICSEKGINLVVLNFFNFGRVVFIICRDFLTEDYSNIINEICPEIVIIQSYTKSFSSFLFRSSNVVKNHGIAYLFNSCNAIKKNKGDKSVLIEYSQSKSNLNNNYSCDECDGKCLSHDHCSYLAKITYVEKDEEYRLNTTIEVFRNGKEN